MVYNADTVQYNLRNSKASNPENAISAAKDEYLIQAVANLGQRLGVKGDSIVSNSFSFRSIFNGAESISSDDYIGCIKRQYGAMYLGIYPKASLNSATISNDSFEISISNSGNIFMTTAALEGVNEEIDRVQFFKDSAVIAARSSNYVFCGVGCNASNEPIEFVYEEFKRNGGDTINNVVSGLKYLQLESNGSKHNLIITLSNDGQTVTVETYELPSGDDTFQNNLDTLYGMLHEMNGDIYDSSTAQYRSYGVTNEAKVNQMSVKYWLNVLKAYKYSSTKRYAKYGKDSANNEISWDEPIEGDIASKYDLVAFSTFNWFTYDDALLDTIKKTYSQELYTSSNEDFKQQILCAIFNGVYDTFPSKGFIYVPIDYEFNYYCNSNDQWKIYGSINDINIRLINRDITPYNIEGYYEEGQLLGNVSGENRTALYTFNVEYDENDSDLVYKINVDKLYTLPYISSDNLWVVNDQITNIPANGEDAGNPNTIIVYNYNNNDSTNSYSILHAAKKDLLTSWSTKWACIPPIDKINVDDKEDTTIVSKNDLLRIGCRLPDLSNVPENEREAITTVLEYALVINVCSIDCFAEITQDVIDRYGENGVVTTLWTFNSKTLSFDVLQNPSYNIDEFGIVAMDITAMTNLNNLVKWHIEHTEYKHPDKYSNKWVVLDNANYELKNNVNDYQTYIYPVIINKPSSEMNELNYDNNLNLFLKFSDNVIGAEEEYITNVGDNKTKYFTSSQLSVSNSLYYLQHNLSRSHFYEYIPSTNFPALNLGEVLVENASIANRMNIVSFNSKGYAYYTYVGSAFDDFDKNIVHFGTSTYNINLGKECMVNSLDTELFRKPGVLGIDFDRIDANGYLNVKKDARFNESTYVSLIKWDVAKHYDRTIYKTNYIPESRYIFQTNPSVGASFDYTAPLQFNNTYSIKFKGSSSYESMIDGQISRYYKMASSFMSKSYNMHDYRMWIPAFYVFRTTYITTSKIIYYGDALYLPALLCKLGLGEYCSKLSKVNLESNMETITYGNQPLMLMTSNMFIKDVDYSTITETSDNVVWKIDSSKIFTGNSLDISYYIDDLKVLNISINECSSKQKISNLFALKLNY